MPRPHKRRRVENIPDITLFKPAGTPMNELDLIVMTVEELEAIRLKDLDGLEQEECADRMEVSRPTFARVLTSARQKIAEALIKGAALKIEGGHFEVAVRTLQCGRCRHRFEVPFGEGKRAADMDCPECGAYEVRRIDGGRRGNGRGGRKNGCDVYGQTDTSGE